MIESYKLSSEFIAFVPQHCLYIFLFFIRFPRTTDSKVFFQPFTLLNVIYSMWCMYMCVCVLCVCFILSR